MNYDDKNKVMIGDKGQHLLEALILAQHDSGDNSLSEGKLEDISGQLDIPLSRVLEVTTFYSLLSTTPRGHNIIQLCDSPICITSGKHNITELFEEALGIQVGETTPDGMFTLEQTSCIGACDVSPAALINGVAIGNLDKSKIDAILCKYREEAENDG